MDYKIDRIFKVQLLLDFRIVQLNFGRHILSKFMWIAINRIHQIKSNKINLRIGAPKFHFVSRWGKFKSRFLSSFMFFFVIRIFICTEKKNWFRKHYCCYHLQCKCYKSKGHNYQLKCFIRFHLIWSFWWQTKTHHYHWLSEIPADNSCFNANWIYAQKIFNRMCTEIFRMMVLICNSCIIMNSWKQKEISKMDAFPLKLKMKGVEALTLPIRTTFNTKKYHSQFWG